MKRAVTMLLFLLFAVTSGGAEGLVFPPELRWWLDEVHKANPQVTLAAFQASSTETRKLDPVKVDTAKWYPVFFRWNYSGTQFAYYDRDTSLTKQKDGKYLVSGDIDSWLSIVTRDGTRVFSDTFGSSRGLNALCWTRDTVLVAVGTEVGYDDPENPRVDLIIREYRLTGTGVQIREFLFLNAFDNRTRLALPLNWWQQRPDYFQVD